MLGTAERETFKKLIRRLTSAAWVTTSYPFTDAEPESGLANVVNALIRVVFPAPFGPRTAWIVPAGTAMSMPSRTI